MTYQLQRTIVNTLYRLNLETLDLKALTKSSPNSCELRFEFGIAEQGGFNFLDIEELARFLRIQDESKEPLRLLDFFCVMRYYTATAEGRHRPLKFDYVLLRFVFHRRIMEIFIAHEQGTQRIPLEDLTIFLANRVNIGLKQNGLKTLTLKHLHML